MDGTVGTIWAARLRGGRRSPNLRQLLPEFLAILACVTVIWAAVFLTLWQARDAAIETAERQATALSHAFAESTERISAALDRELLALRSSVAEKGGAFNLMEWERTQSSPDHLTLQLALIDRFGFSGQNSAARDGQPVDLSDREHFRVHLDPERDALFISKPVIGRITKQCAVQFTRKILDRDGSFAGVGVDSVSCGDLSRLYETADIDGGFVMLAGLDGIIRGYGPVQPSLIGADLSRAPGFEPALSALKGTLTASTPWDGVRRIVSFRRLGSYPLVVLVGYDDQRIFRQYGPLRDRAIAIGGVATVFIVVLGGVWIQQRVRSAGSRRALLLTLDNMSQGIVMIDADGRIPVVNRRAVELLDLPPALLEAGRESPKAEAVSLGLLPPVAEGLPGSVEHGAMHKTGRIIETLSQHLPGGGLVRTFTDVTERRIAEARIRHMAHHDPLTGLANRSLLNERIGELSRNPDMTRFGGSFGLVWLDLDGFRRVNDTLGHEAGDRLLGEVSRRLFGLIGNKALLARTGGDEFAVLCTDGAQPETTEAIATAIVTALSDAIEVDGTQFGLSASLGIAFHPGDGTTSGELLKHAVTAMYHAKQRGRGLIVQFDPEMDRGQRERDVIERDLRVALRNRELEVWFQPRFETRGLRISGFEALARWRHPERGFIPPAEFIPVAEQCGLIAELGMRVLRDACVFAASLPSGRIAVNLSPVQFLAGNLAEMIGDVLAENKLAPDRLELEITEGVLIADETQALSTLKSLHERHLHLALDDFGTGYASLSYLRRFPFDRIKIDQSFVRAQEHDTTTRAIIESILTMARRLHLEVTAEGVETERQLNLLLRQGCPEVQGYLLGRPMPANDAREFQASRATGAKPRRGAFDLTAA
jgi:diguanylate cyclase (GGDEF)-like protein